MTEQPKPFEIQASRYDQGVVRWTCEKRAAEMRERIALVTTHPTTTGLPDGRVQVTLTAEEWAKVRETG